MDRSSRGDRLRPLQVVPHFVKGGAEKVALDLHLSLLDAGHHSYLVALSGPAIDHPNCRALGVSHPRSPLCVARLKRWLITQQRTGWNPTVIHTHLVPDQLWVPFAARSLGLVAPLMTTEHSTFSRRRRLPLGRVFDRRLYAPYQDIICVSEAVQASLTDWLPMLEERTTVIENGVDLARFGAWKGHADDQPLRIVAVGRLTGQKNIGAMVDAMALLPDVPCELWIVGEGELRNRIEGQIQKQGLGHKIRLLGWRCDIPDVLSTADVFLMPSVSEGFGLAAVEAMAAGVPGVVSDTLGLATLTDGEACVLCVPPQDTAAIAGALRQLLSDQPRRRRMGENAARQAARYDISIMKKRYFDVYERLSQA